MICCGQERSTRFCPDCGKALKAGGLWDLLLYVGMTAKKHRTRAETARESSEYNGHTEDLRQKLLGDYRSFSASAEKWESWAEALDKLLSNS